MVLPFFNSCPRYIWGCTCLGRTFRHLFRFHYPFPCKIQYIFRISKLGFMDDRLKVWHISIIFGFAIFSQFLPWLPISLRVFWGCCSLPQAVSLYVSRVRAIHRRASGCPPIGRSLQTRWAVSSPDHSQRSDRYGPYGSRSRQYR